MASEQGPFKLDNPWPRIGWWSTAGLLAVAVILGFVVLGREQQNGPTLRTWTAICRALGTPPEIGRAAEPQPPLRTPSRIAWTSATLAQVAGGNAEHGAFVALNCTACHGEQGVSQTGLYPTLAGMDATVIYKQLDDFRSGKRSWGAMNAIALALSPQDSADVAVYYARARPLRPAAGRGKALPSRPYAARKRSCHSPGLCRRSGTRHPALRRVSRSGRPKARGAPAEDTAAGLYRAPACRVRPGVSPERHQRANAHHRRATEHR